MSVFNGAFNGIFIEVILLFSVAMAITGVVEYFQRSTSIALVIAGLVLGYFQVDSLKGIYDFVSHSSVFQILIILVLLPALLGEASLNLPLDSIKRHKGPILYLAFGATLISYFLVTLFSHYILGLPIIVAFVLGSLMAATDPISVLATFKRIGVDKGLSTIVEGESIFNDGIAVVLFQISTLFLTSYIEMGWLGIGEGFFMFLKYAIGGFLLGGIMGYIFSRITSLFDDFRLEVSFSIILFYGSYFIAEQLHISGVIAVAVSGIILGSYGRKVGMTEKVVESMENFWGVIVLIANSIIFFMLGLEINKVDFGSKWLAIILAIVIVLVARSISVYTSLALSKIPLKWKHTINWGGLRGSLAVALALSLPKDFPGRENLLALTFSIVIFSLTLQSLSIEPFIKLLKLKPSKGDG